MSSGAPSSHHDESGAMMLIAAGLLLVVFFLFEPYIFYFFCALLYYLWSFADFPKLHTLAATKMNILAHASQRTEAMSISQFLDVMEQTAGILWLILLPLAVYGLIATSQHPLNRTRRRITIYSLPRIMAAFSPVIIPSLYYGDRKTLLLNTDPPEHRSAMTPEEFASTHNLVRAQRLDQKLARQVFAAQLGTPLKNQDSFSACERAIVAILGLQVFCGDRPGALTLVDTLNRSCSKRHKEHNKRRGYPKLSLADSAFCRVMNTPKARAWLKRHSTTRTALSALHNQDLRLPAGQFRWLKGLDRTLWYALSSSGRPKVFVEGAGVVTAAHWETLTDAVAGKLHTVVAPPDDLTLFAVRGLQADLQLTGTVIEDYKPGKPDETRSEKSDHDDVIILQNHPLIQETEFIR